MNIIDFHKICIGKHSRAYFLRVQPDDLKVTLSQIFDVLSDLSWISSFDEDYIRASFQERAETTLADIYTKITTSSTDEVSSDAGEYVVSELAREAIVDKLGYLDIPLAELYNKKKSGNPGFDFHSQSLDEVVIFGEAKYLDDRNAYGSGLKQVVRFISNKKDIKDLADLRDFCSQNALSSASKGIKGFAVAFSAKSTPSNALVNSIIFFDSIVRRIQSNFPETKCVFAHPFVSNPEAQLQKNNFDIDDSKAFRYTQKCVGQIFFAHDGTSYFHFGLDTDIMGKRKIRSDFDPVLRAIHTGGSVLIYTTKASIYDKTVFSKFKLYIDECRSLTDPQSLQLIDQFKKCIGANDKGEGYYASSMLEYMRKGIVVHHGSLPLQARLILEHFTQKGFCRLCFATSTLEQGINMPFDVVYLNTFQASRTLSMKNLIGRAGRSTTRSRFDYGSVVIKSENMSAFRTIMLNDEVLSATSLLDSTDGEDSELHDFKEAINSGTYSDEYNLTNSEVQRLSDTNINMLVKTALDSLFEGEHLISLAQVNADYDSKLHLYENLCALYRYYLNDRTLSEGEESVLNTAIKILLWKIHCKTFKSICWYRYAYVARIPERRVLAKKYRVAKTPAERQRIRATAATLSAKFIRGYDDIPNRSLPNYSIYKRGTKATDVDYDRIVFDTYDYLDKLISFKLSDIFYAIFSEYHKRTNDIRALKMAQYFKYGTDNENEIWMLRYGLSFEDIETLKPYLVSIGQEEIVFSADIQNLSPEQIKPVERYL